MNIRFNKRSFRVSLAIPAVVLFIFACVFTVASALRAQHPNADLTLRLSDTADGFGGSFSFERQLYGIQNSVASKRFSTVISRPDGSPLVSARESDGVISVTLPTGQLKIEIAAPAEFSPEEVEAIRAFVTSPDAALVRRIVYEVRNRRLIEKQPRLTGFRVIAMLLGDGDVMISSAEKNIDRSKLTFKLAHSKSERSNGAARTCPSCDGSNCCGCCGPGCWGCTGCYTVECLAHDLCVDAFGYTSSRCMKILPLAVASMESCGGF